MRLSLQTKQIKPGLAKICLVFPRTFKSVHGIWPPLGIIQLGTILKKNGYNVKLLDSSFDETLDNIKNQIREFKPDIVGVSALSDLYSEAKEIIKFSKELGAITIMGGPHATILPKQTLENIKDLDVVAIGEGDETIMELVKAFETGNDLNRISGIAFRENEKIVFTRPRQFIQNLDKLPFPDRSLLNVIDRYLESRALNLNAIRGCPFQCKFCKPTLDMLFGKKIRWSSAKYVANQLEWLYKKYKLRDMFFVDDTFTLDKKWMRTLTEELRNKKLLGVLRFVLNSRVDIFDEETAKIIKELGCYQVAFGVESGSQKILDSLNKGTTVEQIRKAFTVCKKYKFRTHAYFMIGSPGETKQTLAETEKIIDEIQPSTLFLAVTTPLLGTYLYDDAKNQGLLNIQSQYHLDYHGYREKQLPLKLKHITYDEIIEFKKRVLAKRKGKLLFSNAIELVKDVIAERSLAKVFFRWKLYKKMQGYFG